jgi:hypothetical protein
VADIPIVITSSGLQPTPPATLRQLIEQAAELASPGYTGNLPGSLIEDILSTDVGAVAVCDAAKVETVNSLTPLGANAFLLSQLGQIYLGSGSAPATPTNTSVSVVFQVVDNNNNPLAGQVIAVGFTVSDGVYQYVVQDGGVTNSDGFSQPLFCLASTPGTWTIPTNTVSQIVTSVPSSIFMSCTNPLAGVPGAAAETEEMYRARVLQAGLATAQGMPTMLKTMLSEVPGVQARLVSVLQKTGDWEIIVGGGDPYEVADAIFRALFDISTLVGSTLSVVSISQAANAVVVTDLNHGYSNGQLAVMSGIQGMVPLNGIEFTVTVINQTSFSIAINTEGYPAYIGGGVVSPNLRNVSVNINDYPDVYAIPFVDPPQQTVAIAVTWNTSSPNFVSSAAVAQLSSPALVNYVNSVKVGAPINLFELQTTFQVSIASILDPSLLTRMEFAVSINGIGVEPVSGTGVIAGDPESYFLTSSASISVVQG